MITEAQAEEYLDAVDTAPPEEQQRMLGALRDFREAQRQKEQEQRDAYTRELFKDPDTLGGHVTPAMQKTFAIFSDDPKRTKAEWANTRFLANVAGISVEQAASSYEPLLAKYSHELFGGEPQDGASFYGAVSKMYADRDAKVSAINLRDQQAVARGIGDFLAGQPPLWASHLGEFKFSNAEQAQALGNDPERMDVEYGESYMRGFTLMSENPVIGQVFDQIAWKMGRTDLARPGIYGKKGEGDLQQIAAQFMELPPEVRQEALTLLPAYLEANGEKNPRGVVASTAEMFRQMADAMGRGADSFLGSGARIASGERQALRRLRELEDGDEVRLEDGAVDLRKMTTQGDYEKNESNLIYEALSPLSMVTKLSDDDGPVATPEQRAELIEQAKQQMALYSAYRELDQLAKEGFKPLRNVTPLGAFERGFVYGAAESGPMMAVGSIPIIGTILMAAGMRTQEYNRLRLEHPEMSPEQADLVSFYSAIPMAAIERLQLKGIAQGSFLFRIPALERFFKQMGSPTSKLWRPFLGKLATGVPEQLVQEGVQNAIPGMVFNALTEDYPEVDWAAAFGDTVTDLDTFFTVLPFVLVGSGVSTWRESRAVAKALPRPEALRMNGIPEEKAHEIAAEAVAGRLDNAEALFQEAWASRTKEDVARGAELMKVAVEQQKATLSDPALPQLRQSGDVFEMVEPDGTVTATFDSEETAQSQFFHRLAWEKVGHARTVRELIEWFKGKRSDVVVEEAGKTKTVAEGMDENPLNVAALAERMRIAAIEEGVDPSTLIIKGETTQELREGIMRDVVKIYHGADVMTVVEEYAHAQLNKELREGTISREEVAQAAADWARETGFRLEDPSQPTDIEIQEAMADMVQAHFMNERKRLPGLPASVRAFIAKARVYFKEMLGRARTLQEMREAGRISDEIEGFLARSLGIDEQVELNRATTEAVGAAVPSYSIGKITDRSEVWNKPEVAVVRIDSEKLPGKKRDWHHALRSWISSQLQGQVITNEHSGLKVKFNAESKAEGPSKLREEKAFRALKSADQIVKDALYVDSSAATDTGRSAAYHYFIVPVEIDGAINAAWFNIREPSAKDASFDGVFYEFGVDLQTKVAHSPQRSESKTLASMNGPHINTTSFLESVKGGIADHIPPKPGEAFYSIGRADYLTDLAASLDARRGSEMGLAFAEKVQANLERGARSHELLERMVRLEQQQDARALQLEEDIANLQLRLEGGIEDLRSQKAEQITKAGTESMAKFMDRIEAAKTEREKMLLRREARETAADLKRGIEKDFKAQEKALRERYQGEERVLREKALGREKAEKAKADAADQRAAMLQALVDYNAILMALPPEVRGKLGGFVALAKLKTDRARATFFRERFPKVQAAFEKYLRTEYDAALKKLFARAKPKRDKAGKKPLGKLGADLHALFKTLEEAMHWTAAEVAEHIAKLEGRLAEGELSPEAEARTQMEIGLVNLVGDWKNAESSRRGAAVENLKEVLRKGYGDYLIQKMEERAVRKEMRLRLIADTGKSGRAGERDARLEKDAGLLGSLRAMKFELSSFEQLLGYCFGPMSADAQRLADLQRLADNSRVDAEHMVSDGVNALFTELGGSVYKGAEVHWRLSQKSMKVQGRSLSELEAISATLMWRQEDGRRHMEGIRDEEGVVTSSWSYGQEFIDEIEAKLSPEAMAVRDYLAGEYAAEYDLINPLFRKMNGVDLPKNANYSPLTVKPMQAGVGEVVDPVTGVAVNAASATPGSFRTRGRLTAEPDFRDAVKVFMAHKSQMNHWQAYAEFSLEARSVLGNREVMNAVEARAGKAAIDALSGWLDYLIQGGNRDAAMRLEVNGMLSRMLSRAASIAIVGRIGVLAVQSTQLGAALAEMPTASYLKRMGQLFTGQLGWRDAIDSAYIQRRMIEMPPLVRQAVEGLKAEKPTRVKHAVQALGRTIAGADALFTAGTYAMVYDFRLTKLKEQGMSDADAQKQARREAERVTDRLAQPVRPGARSLYEMRTTGNPATRLLWAFASEARKNLGLAMYAMSNRTMAEKARTLAYVAVINPLIASLIRAAWRDARDAEDEGIFDEKHWNAKRMALAVATEPLAGVPVVGEMAQELIYKSLGVYMPSGNLLSSGANAVPAIQRLPETLAGDQDAEQVLRDAESILTGMGLFNANFAAAASLSHIVRDLFGVGENMTESAK